MIEANEEIREQGGSQVNCLIRGLITILNAVAEARLQVMGMVVGLKDSVNKKTELYVTGSKI